MTRKLGPDHKIDHNVQWEGKLPSTYETILDGFHAKMTVSEMVAYLKLDKKNIPEKIKDVKIGSFTPDTFAHEDFFDFWQTPVSPHHLYDYPELFNALEKDKHIPGVQASTGFKVDKFRPTLETLARIAQTQYLGFNLRMGELTSKNMYARLEKLRDPKYYDELVNSSFVKKHKLQNELPKTMPKFEMAGEKFSVKKINSAIDKAYTRSGKPDSIEEFLKKPDNYGVFAVSDMQRTCLVPAGAEFMNPEEREKHYTQLRNVLAVGLMSGELGVVPKEMTDSLHYPLSARASDQYPIMMTKGKMRHEGPDPNCYLSTYIEIQVGYVPDHAKTTTHEMYENSRSLTDKGEKKNAENARIEVINTYIPEQTKEQRQEYLKTKQVRENDPLAKMFHGNAAELLTDRGSRTRALEVACSEFHKFVTRGKNRIEKLDFSKMTTKVIQSALRAMIRKPEEEILNNDATVYEMKPNNVYQNNLG
jgi:hypothetical protein